MWSFPVCSSTHLSRLYRMAWLNCCYNHVYPPVLSLQTRKVSFWLPSADMSFCSFAFAFLVYICLFPTASPFSFDFTEFLKLSNKLCHDVPLGVWLLLQHCFGFANGEGRLAAGPQQQAGAGEGRAGRTAADQLILAFFSL